MSASELNIKHARIRIMELLAETSNPLVLQRIQSILENSHQDWWDEIGDDEKAEIEEGLKQADNGDLTAHESVMAKYE